MNDALEAAGDAELHQADDHAPPPPAFVALHSRPSAVRAALAGWSVAANAWPLQLDVLNLVAGFAQEKHP